jgi:hypothetical protein
MGLLVGLACTFFAGMELEIILSSHLPPFSSVLSVCLSYLCDSQSTVGLEILDLADIGRVARLFLAQNNTARIKVDNHISSGI